jgi:hypothetical protein
LAVTCPRPVKTAEDLVGAPHGNVVDVMSLRDQRPIARQPGVHQRHRLVEGAVPVAHDCSVQLAALPEWTTASRRVPKANRDAVDEHELLDVGPGMAPRREQSVVDFETLAGQPQPPGPADTPQPDGKTAGGERAERQSTCRTDEYQPTHADVPELVHGVGSVHPEARQDDQPDACKAAGENHDEHPAQPAVHGGVVDHVQPVLGRPSITDTVSGL